MHLKIAKLVDVIAVGLVPVVSLPETMMSVNPSVVLSITDDSMPASRFVSLASDATAQVNVCLLPYLMSTLFGIIHPLLLLCGH